MMKSISSLKSGLLLATLLLTACGGGGGGGSHPAESNVMSVIVDRGPTVSGNVNQPFVSVTICEPGNSANCQTIDHVLIDTGSTGLRLVADAVSSTVLAGLPSRQGGGGVDLMECQAFVSGYLWGSVRLADVKLGGLTASNLAIQVIGDPAAPTVPSDCSSRGGGYPMNSVEDLGAKGVLGIDAFVADCPACALASSLPVYYNCPGGTCITVQLAEAEQILNPVAALPTDNNGILLTMPAVGTTGASNVSGSLILGVGTRSNNSLGSAKVFDLDDYGELRTWYKNTGYWSFFDSGSNGLFFPDATIAACTHLVGFFCPTPWPLALSGEVAGAVTNNWTVIDFSVGNADTLLATYPNTAYSNLVGDWPGTTAYFDWGMPFFYGRRVFFAIDGRSTPGGTGPYVAF
jgi:hypothetical protein